jgi:hypothetical protein
MDQIRAAWSRRTDDELLRACFIEEMAPDGRRVVTELVTAKFGSPDAYVARYDDEQGAVIGVVKVRGCDVDPSVKQQSLPLMWGFVVVAANGIGFVPGGHDDDAIGELGDFFLGPLVGRVGGSIVSSMKRTAHPIHHLAGTGLPVPLLARIDANSIWLPHDRYDEVMWGPDFGEVSRGGERLFSVEPLEDGEAIVAEWAASHHVSFTALDPAPLLR